MKRVLVGLMAVCLPAVAAQAAEEDTFFSELPVIASVSRLPQQARDLPTSVTVLDREAIKASGARDISDLLRMVPGFQTFAHTTDPTRVSYHGLTDDDFSPRVQVLLDGRSLYSPLFKSGVNWSLLPVAIEDIERIEVVRGTNAASHGTNAFMGVINIVTLDPALVRGFNVSTQYGSQGVRDYTLRSGSRLGELGEFRFTYQQKDDQALSDRGTWSDAYRSRLFDIRSDFQLSNRDQLQFRLGRVESRMLMGLVSGSDQPGNPLHPFDQSSTYLQADWIHSLGEQSEIQLRYAYTRDRAYDSFTAFSSAFNLFYGDGSFTGHSTRQELEFQHTAPLAEHLRLAWGLGYRQDRIGSDLLFYGNQQYSRQVTRQFGNLEWKPLSWLTANLGSSLDQDSYAGDSVSPRAALSFHLNPENTLRLAAARGVRSASVLDYRGDKRFDVSADAAGNPIAPGSIYKFGYYGNRNLPQERLHSVELGYLGDWRNLAMSLDVRVFREIIPNRLLQAERSLSPLGLCDVLCPNSTADFLVEAQRIRIEGAEYQWQWRPRQGTRLMVAQAYTRIRATYLDSYLNDPVITNAYLSASALARDRLLAEDSAPRLSNTLMWMQELAPGWQASLLGTHQGAMKWTRNTTAEAYTRIDARLAYAFKVGGNPYEVALVSQSLNGAHGEFKAMGLPDDRIVTRRTWLSLSAGL